MKFPYECTRCGLCCLMELCQIAIADGYTKACPHLYFDGDKADCYLAGIIIPIGDGCCIKARAYKDGVEYDFAALSKEMKIKAVKQIRRKINEDKKI